MFGFLTDVACRDHSGIESKCGEFITKKSSNNNGTKYKSRKCKRFDLDTNITIRHESELHGKVCPRRRNEHKESFNRNSDSFRALWTVGGTAVLIANRTRIHKLETRINSETSLLT